MARPAAPLPRRARRRRPYWSVIIFILLMSGAGIRAYKDPVATRRLGLLERPVLRTEPDIAADRQIRPRRLRPRRAALAISGTIGPAAASWFRDRLDEARLAAGDAVLLSSPAGIWTRPSSSVKSFDRMGW